MDEDAEGDNDADADGDDDPEDSGDPEDKELYCYCQKMSYGEVRAPSSEVLPSVFLFRFLAILRGRL